LALPSRSSAFDLTSQFIQFPIFSAGFGFYRELTSIELSCIEVAVLLAQRRPTTKVLEGDMEMRIKQRFCNFAKACRPKPFQPVRPGLQIAAGLLVVAIGACIFPTHAEPSPTAVPQMPMETGLGNANSAAITTNEALLRTSTAFVAVSKDLIDAKGNPEPIEQVHAHSAHLQVQVYDYAGLHPTAFEEFRKQLEEILVGNGLSVEINLCTKNNSALCDTRPEKTRRLLVRVVARQPGTKANTARLPLGQSFVNEVGGKYATVFLEPVVQRATEANVSWKIVLGYAAAHEIGHLLFGNQAHTPWGLMKATWDHNDFVAMRQNKLPLGLRTNPKAD
jgi:hypothetical protein